eukprot:TRINITY_DN5857_c0_g1_i5.p1 TRINITY_DN5857_c0_g1~~TRINITY_DN5857_c0_g1_i5.p1  ORF type:complete len:539 (+),score=162.37 TRINITY_DN5857_c0_g1_i5:168-1619(+)
MEFTIMGDSIGGEVKEGPTVLYPRSTAVQHQVIVSPENGRINQKQTNKRQANDANKVGNTSLNFNIDNKPSGGVLVANKQVNSRMAVAMSQGTTITVTDEMVPQQYVFLDPSGLRSQVLDPSGLRSQVLDPSGLRSQVLDPSSLQPPPQVLAMARGMTGMLEGGKEMSHHNVHLATRPDTNTSMVTKAYSVGVAGGTPPSAITTGVIAKKTVLPLAEPSRTVVPMAEPSNTVVPVGQNKKEDEEFVDTMPTQSNSRTTVANSSDDSKPVSMSTNVQQQTAAAAPYPAVVALPVHGAGTGSVLPSTILQELTRHDMTSTQSTSSNADNKKYEGGEQTESVLGNEASIIVESEDKQQPSSQGPAGVSILERALTEVFPGETVVDIESSEPPPPSTTNSPTTTEATTKSSQAIANNSTEDVATTQQQQSNSTVAQNPPEGGGDTVVEEGGNFGYPTNYLFPSNIQATMDKVQVATDVIREFIGISS